MLTKDEIRGVIALPPTPCKEGAGGWDAVDSVNLEEAARLAENLIQAGVGGIGGCGTTGECAALLADEKREYIATLVEVARKRVPIIGGATCLGIKETVLQMKGLRDVGASAALIGLPLWQTPTMEAMVQFYADLAEAVPDLPVMVYANSMFFKSNFPTEFWAGVSKRAKTTITCKVSYGIEHIKEDMDVAGHQINFMLPESGAFAAYEKVGTRVKACWATSAGSGPEPVVAMMDAILRDDHAAAKAVQDDIDALGPLLPLPPGVDFRQEFPKYNAQVQKCAANAAGYANFGPYRAPYQDLPDHYRTHLESYGQRRGQLAKKYSRVAAG